MSFTNSSKPGRAATWKLAPPVTNHPTESAVVADDGRKADAESIIGEDQRALVDFGDLQEGGKYRSIVKIQARFENKNKGQPVWMMGTGWLIRPDVLVTAGHVVYDWGHRYGAATQIKCFIGYNGRASVKTPQVQARHGVNVITTAEWIEAANNRTRDVAFIQVNLPFTGNLRTFNYINTPLSGHGTLLGIVGYPGDKCLPDTDGGSDEYGAQMYEEYAKNSYNIEESPRNMVEYRVSTYGGQSGAPILRRANGQLISIGTHCYGGGGDDSNSGNSIGNAYGNNYEAFVGLFGLASTFGSPGQVHIVDPQAKGTSSSGTGTYPVNGNPTGWNGADGRGNFNGIPHHAEEGFFDVFKSVASIGSSFVGPAIGGLLGAFGAESAMDNGPDSGGSAERALLAEAALQAVLSSGQSDELDEVVGKMQDIWKISAPKLDSLAPALAPVVAECGRQRRELRVHLPESAIAVEEAAFVQGLMGPTRQLAGEEGIFDWLGPVIKTAVSVAKPIASQAASAALSGLGRTIQGAFGAESGISDYTSQGNHEETKVLLKRAVLADTALQALMTLPPQKLARLKPVHEDSGEAEGIFDFLKSTVQKLGPLALDTAKDAAKKYLPRLIDSAGQKISGRLGFQTEASANTGREQGKRPSFRDMLNSNNAGIKVSHALETSSDMTRVDVTHLIRARERAWVPSDEWQKEWDDNDDGPVVMTQPPVDF
ncbi:hypothetical protein NM208_g6666 [Fusarium decemcellulare]|uniref:Uncharacterized protein n=1 Tax=Fusarium decemcellulare TaxID=57161 RepID=A0ACC1SC48_9HYPO|nr:hypothetical protein NM208_g6666 [Fusarium decemcellulare]